MKKRSLFCLCTLFAISVTGCGTATIKPNYASADPELLRIGGDKPADKEPEIKNMGSYCLEIADKWKTDGKTPDAQAIYSKDTFRKTVPCK